MKVPIDLIIPNPQQPRTVFDQAELEGLAESIRENDLIQPIVVEQARDHYILIDGERRWRACQMAGLQEIEVIIKPSGKGNGADRLTKALVANIQRSAMGPVDEARAYARLIQEFGTADAVAHKVGVSNATVSMRLSLLEFPDPVQRLFNLRRLPLDMTIIPALKRLTPDVQTKLATIAATRRWAASAMLRAISIETKRKPGQARKKRKPVEIQPIDGKHFNALALINGKVLPDSLRAAAIKTCEACPLYSEASPAICNQCPLPDFLRRCELTRMES